MINFSSLLSQIFPPAALWQVKGRIDTVPETFKEKMDSSISHYRDDAENVYEWAKFIYESEVSRKETIETKAQSYLMGLSISTGIIAAIPFLFSSRWSLPNFIGITVAVLFTVAIIYMLIAGFYALKTRQSGAMNLPDADLFKKQLEDKTIGYKDNSILLMFYAKKNETLLIEKSNFLYVAEMCFVRAIAIILISILLAIGSKLYQSMVDEKISGTTIASKCDTKRTETLSIKATGETGLGSIFRNQ